MSRDKNHLAASEDAEYQYAGTEGAGEESVVEVPQRQTLSLQSIKEKLLERLPKKKKYRVLLFLGIGVYILSKFLDVGTPSTNSSTPASAKINSQQLTKPSDEELRKIKAAEKKKADKKVEKPAAAAAVSVTTKETLTKTKDTGVSKSSTFDIEGDSHFKELQTNLNQMSDSIKTLESSLLSLTSSVTRLSDKLKVLDDDNQKSKSLLVTTQRRSIFVTYYLQSLTYGRAWIISPSGDYFTSIKVGDFVPGYGQVQNIEVHPGLITTSSGRTITYGPNDS